MKQFSSQEGSFVANTQAGKPVGASASVFHVSPRRTSRRKRTAIASAVAVLAVLAFSVDYLTANAGSDEDKVVAKINGQEIHKKDLASFTLTRNNGQQVTYDDLSAKEREEVIRQVAKKKLLKEKAVEEGVEKDQEFKDQYDSLLSNVLLSRVVKQAVTMEQIKSRYDALSAELKGKEEIRARHILVKTEKEAKEIEDTLKKKKSSFEQLAKEKSLDQANASKGGELGYMVTGNMLKEFETAALALKKGELSAPVQTKVGWHVIELEDRRPAVAAPFEKVKNAIAQDLSRQAVDSYTDDLISKAKIEIVDKTS